MKLICNDCKKNFPLNSHIYKCKCGGHLIYNEDVIFNKSDIKKERFNMWRYDKAYPLKYDELKVTFNEGLTPLVKVPNTFINLRAKMDNLMPTGSFKDRGTVMVVNYLIKNGATKITEDSSGNAGASVAAYCALGNIECDIFIPKGNSFGKTIQIYSYGANIHEIEGSREDVEIAAQKEEKYYAGHNWHPMFIEGTKSLAYEIWEQNNFEAPGNIVAVAGNGSTILGIYYGFKILLKNKEISKMPRLFAVQTQNCNPMYRKFFNLKISEPYSKSIAEGIVLQNPNKINNVIEAVKDTNGFILSIDDKKIIEALKELTSKGFFIEPTSATAYAGILELIKNQTFKKNDDIIMIISGNGLKASNEIAELYK